MLLPKCFHSTVFKELHHDMGHLGADRVIQLARKRFYWPKMESDIIHFVSQACSCLKQRRSNLSTRAPLTSVTTSSPFELVSIDFLHLAYELSWSLLTISPGSHKLTQLKTSQAPLLLIAYIMTSFYDLVSLQKSSMIKVESSRINFSRDYIN